MRRAVRGGMPVKLSAIACCGFGPRAVWMRVIRRPHDAVLSEEVDHAQANMISLKRRPDLSGRPLVLLSILRPSAGWEIESNPASDPALRLSPNNHHFTYPDLGRIALRPSSSPRPSSQAASVPPSLWLAASPSRCAPAASPSTLLH